MPREKVVQDFLSFTNGWVAEGGPFAQVENAFLDAANIIVDADDGSVYRRSGLVSAGSLASTSTGPNPVDPGLWKNPGGDGDDFIVIKVDETLHFYEAGAFDLPNNKKSFTVDLTGYKADSGTSTATVQGMRVSITSGKGYLFVAGAYIEGLYITYDSGSDSITVSTITFTERDLSGSDIALISPDEQPVLFDASHYYNLQNAGWPENWIRSYRNAKGKYPSRALSPWVGVEERVDPGDGDVHRNFRPRLIVEEEFGTSEAPKGHFLLDVFDTRETVTSTGRSDITKITVTAENSSNNGDGSFTYDAHITIEFPVYPSDVGTGNNFDIEDAFSTADDEFDYYVANDTVASAIVNAEHTLTGYTGPEFVFDLGAVATGITSSTSGPAINDGDTLVIYGDDDTSESPGTYAPTTGATSTVIGVQENRRFEHATFWAGRLFTAGCRPETRKELTGRIYYSQLLQQDYHIGRCYQDNDPSAKDFNEVLDTDGGYIEIPEMGAVKALHPRQQSLVVIADNGVWEIKTGEGYFTPTSYLVRNVSSFGMSATGGSIAVDNIILYWSDDGIKQITDSEITALSEGADLSGARIKEFVGEAVTDASMSTAFDPYDGVVYWSFDRSDETSVLALDLRIGAFYRWTFSNDNGTKIYGVFSADRDEDNSGDKVDNTLYFVTHDSNSYDFAQLTGADYIDTAVGDSEDADGKSYVQTRFNFAGDALRMKQAPKVASYLERNSGTSLDVQGRFSWASSGDSGKWTNKQQAYYDRGTGYDVAVSRRKLRGSGRSVGIKWTSRSEAPFRLYGYSLILEGASEV